MKSTFTLPEAIETVEQLEDLMSKPSTELVNSLSKVEGDLMILGVGGKMGPTLARSARRAFDTAGIANRVIGVSRFSDPLARDALEKVGVETLTCDLLNREEVERLPEAPNVVYMAGMKFGTTNAHTQTWAINAIVPGYVAERLASSHIVVFSTGNIYPFTPVADGGATENCLPEPIGEYAQSALARERIFEYFSTARKSRISIIRLNYAVELRYGVLLDIAAKVLLGEPIRLVMGYVNVIWQGDANRQALQSITHCASPPSVFNVAGPETLSVREIAETFGTKLKKRPIFEGTESETALLSNASKANRLFGPPHIPVDTLIDWIANWVTEGKATLNKATHFETRNGKF